MARRGKVVLEKVVGGKGRKKPVGIFFAILIGAAVIAFWRGLWGLFDIYLFPGDAVMRFWTLVIVGLGILIFTRYITKELI
jgi:hypothetical protein